MSYTIDDVAGLLDLPARQIRAWIRAGLIEPARGPRHDYLLSFQDLVLLRTAAELMRANVPTRRITAALRRLRAQLPEGRSLTELRIHASGDEVVVRESSEPPWNPRSGQFHIEFDVGELAASVAPLEHRFARAAETARSAAEWFERGAELEPRDAAAARDAYEHALEIEPGHADARVNLGRILFDGGDAETAESHYRTVLEQGEHALAAYNLGVLLEDEAREDEAIRAYARAIAADEKLAEAYWNLARLYERRGDQHSAIRYFNGYRRLVRRD